MLKSKKTKLRFSNESLQDRYQKVRD